MAPEVTYLGHKIDAEGLHPVAEKVEAIQEAPAPKNVSEDDVLFGPAGLLWVVSAYPVIHISTSVSVAEVSKTLEVDRSGAGCIQ